MGDTVTASNVQVNVPCERCIHTEVCAIKASLVSLRGGVDVAMPKPDPALSVRVALDVDCSQFMPARRKGGQRCTKLNLTEEERERRRQQGRTNLAGRRPSAEPAAVPA